MLTQKTLENTMFVFYKKMGRKNEIKIKLINELIE